MKSKYYKHKTYGHVYGLSSPTPKGRASWPSLVTAKDPPPPQPGQKPSQPRFEIGILLQKGSPEVEAWIGEIKQMTKEMVELFNQGRPAKIAIDGDLLKDGDAFDLEKYPYYKGCWLLVARNSQPTKVYGPKKEDLTPDVVVGGNIIRLVVTPLITAHGVSFKLDGTQFIKDDGVRFGGGLRDASSFLDVIEDESDEVAAELQDETESVGTTSQVVIQGGTPLTPPETPPQAATQSIRERMTNMVKGKRAALDKL